MRRILMRKLAWSAMIALCVITLGLLATRGRRDAEPVAERRAEAGAAERAAAVQGDADAAAQEAATAAALRRAPGRGAGARARRLPPSLRGTDVDGGLTVGGDGRFVADRDAVALFEYYLTALGEESYEAVVARITAEIDSRLVAPASAQAIEFLQRYLDYRSRAAALGDAEQAVDLEQGFERLRSLRREVFGEPLATDLFGAQEAHAEVTLLQRDIASDPGLDDDTKRALIEQAFDALPIEQRESLRRATSHLELAEAEARLRDEGATAAQIRSERERRFGSDAAERLEALDRRRAEWQRRVEEYRDQRTRIESDASLGADDKHRLVAELLADAFSEPERIRVRALDRMQASR